MDQATLIARVSAFLEDVWKDRNTFVLDAGGAMMLYGLREQTEDIDVTVDKVWLAQNNHQPLASLPLWSYNFYSKEEHPSGKAVWSVGGFLDIHEDVLPKSAVVVCGIACRTLEDILIQKEKWNRPKDQADIQKIRNYLKENPDYRNQFGRIDFDYLNTK